MPSKGSPKVVVRLPARLLADLRAAAANRSTPDAQAPDSGMSGIIREAVAVWLEQWRATRPVAEQASQSPPEPKPSPPPPPTPRTMRVRLVMRVQANSKFVRHRSRAQREIEEQVLSGHGMEKPDTKGWEYLLTIPYQTDAELDGIIYDILDEAESIADGLHCFTETDVVSLDDPEKQW